MIRAKRLFPVILLGLSVASGIAAAASSLVAEEHAEPRDVLSEPPIIDEDREHWAFQSLRRPVTPNVNVEQRRNANTPIDAFVLAKLTPKDLRLQPEADRATLLRRVTLDLTGLPPTLAEQQQFLQDPRPDAYERLVDRLLASPEYGRRWAQHWLELARFAETDGFEHDKVRADAWRYRDWVIDALNRDTPYRDFLSLQIAGDLLRPEDIEAKYATGFCTSCPDMPDINSMDERHHHVMNEITATVGSALLGLQIGCAQCHDHKYDPLSQADFYRLRAYFDDAVALQKNKSLRFLAAGVFATESRLMVRGDWRRPGPSVEAATPRVLRGPSTTAPRDRAELARWLAAPDNALPARVFVNRIWQHHFGEGLSRSPSDFGVLGDEPLHPQLLDHLVWVLRDNGGSVKSLHREIMTSAVYRQRSYLSADATPDQQVAWKASLERDRENFYCSRFPRRRLDGESIRDAMLQLAGRLNRVGGGPGVRPPLPAELKKTLLKNQWNESPDPADHVRRSIYVFARRNLRYPIFEAFDRPDANASCPRRNRSTTAPQSLMLLNGELPNQLAAATAARIRDRSPDATSAEQIASAFRMILAREPTPEEQRIAQRFLSEPGDRRLTELCLTLFNSNAFVYVD